MENHKPYVILHIRDTEPFHCESQFDEKGEPVAYMCQFEAPPLNRLAPISTDFFTIDCKEKKDRFTCFITSKKRSFIHPLPPPIYQNSTISTEPAKVSKHWIIVGYESKEPPYLDKPQSFHDVLRFPINFQAYKIPTIGAVDINGEPVFVKKNRDIERFLVIKEAFELGKYRKTYELASDALESYPQSIFTSDFLRYKIKALVEEDLKEHTDEIVKLSKEFIRRFTSDENLPEVLLHLARVYTTLGFYNDADYYFKRLVDEHKNSKFADLGEIYWGDRYHLAGDDNRAVEHYLNAYYHAKDVDTASLAAYKIALRSFEHHKLDEAIAFLKKIWDKNRLFLLKNPDDAHKLARKLAAKKVYDFAIDINRALLDSMEQMDDRYETLLYEIAKWYEAKGDLQSAIAWYKKYLDAFAFGQYSDHIKQHLDALFVESNEANATEALRQYDRLIREYEGSAIADKALVAKISILLKQKRYDEILALVDQIQAIKDSEAKKRAETMFQEAVNTLFDDAAHEQVCKIGIVMVEKYGVNVAPKHESYLYDCYVKYARYEEALRLAQNHLSDKKVSDRLTWLCRTVAMLTALERYKEAYDALKDFKALAGKKQAKVCPNLPLNEVKIDYALGKYASVITTIHELSKVRNDDMRMADLYRLGYDAARKSGDQLQQIWMLKTLVALQNSKASHPYSPWAEFELIRLYKLKKAYEKALQVAEAMEKLELKGEERARWFYEKGVLYEWLGKKERAEKIFESCSDLKEGGAWQKLCKEALSL
ncbi:MAG: hypothetical protein DSY46_04230 [Hydrogenimonas sp.]|nr:MAG: hypothetical protein DSY46_04230 [Hydrogenimonas sp.]